MTPTARPGSARVFPGRDKSALRTDQPSPQGFPLQLERSPQPSPQGFPLQLERSPQPSPQGFPLQLERSTQPSPQGFALQLERPRLQDSLSTRLGEPQLELREPSRLEPISPRLAGLLACGSSAPSRLEPISPRLAGLLACGSSAPSRLERLPGRDGRM